MRVGRARPMLGNNDQHHLKPVSFFVAVHKDAPLPPPRESYFALGLGGYRPPNYPFAFSDDTGESYLAEEQTL